MLLSGRHQTGSQTAQGTAAAHCTLSQAELSPLPACDGFLSPRPWNHRDKNLTAWVCSYYIATSFYRSWVENAMCPSHIRTFNWHCQESCGLVLQKKILQLSAPQTDSSLAQITRTKEISQWAEGTSVQRTERVISHSAHLMSLMTTSQTAEPICTELRSDTQREESKNKKSLQISRFLKEILMWNR